MIFDHIPGLDEIAFEGRNKDYGSYFLRKRYPRYLFISFITGTAFVLLIILIFWLSYYFEPLPDFETDQYSVEYYNMSPPPEDESAELAKSAARPEEPVPQAPVVTDSIKTEKPQEEPKPESTPEPKANIDSAAKPGGSGLGPGAGEENGLATSIDVYPRFPGGDEARLNYLRRPVRYPDAALKAQVQGVVMVVFVVERDGTITNIDVLKRIGGGCDDEAIRVTREMPRWDPGKRQGKPVRVMVRMPIVFRIPGK